MELFFKFGFGIMGLTVILTAIILVLICIAIIRVLSSRRSDRGAEQLCISARVIGKRMRISRTNGYRSVCRYYATFETENGDRIELLLPEREYGVLFEGDFGLLTFQGTRFLSFARR